MLKGKLVRLREYRKEDIPVALQYMNDTEVARNLSNRTPFPYTLEDEEKWYAKQSGSNELYSFAIETLEEGKYIGGCGINHLDWKNSHATIGIYIGDQEYWSKGYGSDALKILMKFIFNEMNIHKIKLGVFAFNGRAIKCYEKCGFKQDGILREEIFKNGRYYDVWEMSILRDEYKDIEN
nr:GNAT family protein [uncultured Niameybacter sp.]